MSRFEREWALVPEAARWIAVLVCLACAVLIGSMVWFPAVAAGGAKMALVTAPILLASLIGAAGLGAYVLLVGYVYGDARRRGMNRVLWTLLAIFIPNGIGIILYFILRDPVPVPCPSCGAPARKGHAYCARCGQAVRPACPQCREPVEPDWRNCARCGAPLATPAGRDPQTAAGPSTGAA
jgi:Double zinc ribbon/Phospholipase_D-nuclease N-terminal